MTLNPKREVEDLSLFDTIIYYLDNNGFEYEILEHDFVHGSADAAKVRETSLAESAKALVLEGTRKSKVVHENNMMQKEKILFMGIVSGHRKLDFEKIKAIGEFDDVKLAHPDKVLEKTTLVIGKIPPLPFLFEIEGFFDADILHNEYVVFSAASNYKSVRMFAKDLLEISGAKLANIGKNASM